MFPLLSICPLPPQPDNHSTNLGGRFKLNELKHLGQCLVQIILNKCYLLLLKKLMLWDQTDLDLNVCSATF